MNRFIWNASWLLEVEQKIIVTSNNRSKYDHWLQDKFPVIHWLLCYCKCTTAYTIMGVCRWMNKNNKYDRYYGCLLNYTVIKLNLLDMCPIDVAQFEIIQTTN